MPRSFLILRSRGFCKEQIPVHSIDPLAEGCISEGIAFDKRTFIKICNLFFHNQGAISLKGSITGDGTTGGKFGSSVTSPGDLNGDGFNGKNCFLITNFACLSDVVMS